MNNDNKNTGALWEKTSKTGNQYYSGNLTIDNIKYKLTMFINDKKGNEKSPDYRLIAEFEALPKIGQAVEEVKEDPFKDMAKEGYIELTDDDLPF